TGVVGETPTGTVLCAELRSGTSVVLCVGSTGIVGLQLAGRHTARTV
ncbi:unnamed protein product, partial [Sphacelaria rigidula]